MASFFEKLKKGMGVEEPIIEKEETEMEDKVKEVEEGKPSSLPVADAREDKSSFPPSLAKADSVKEEIKTVKKPRKPRKQKQVPEFKVEVVPETIEKEPEDRKERKWPSFGRGEEGQLTIDVYQTENDLVIQSAIAGVKPENLDISIERDIIIIKGDREKSTGENGDYFIRECFWGPFSREMILPAEVDPSRAKASFKEGILTIRMPKIEREKKRKVIVNS